MTRAEILDQMSQDIDHLTKKDIDEVLVNLLKTIQKKIAVGETIYLRGFGTFGSKIRKERVARNIRTGESIIVPEHKVAFLRPEKN